MRRSDKSKLRRINQLIAISKSEEMQKIPELLGMCEKDIQKAQDNLKESRRVRNERKTSRIEVDEYKVFKRNVAKRRARNKRKAAAK
jgi:hypothetical protein